MSELPPSIGPDPASPPPKPEPRRRHRRWLVWTLLVIVLVPAMLYLLVPLIAAPIVRSKLQGMVDSRLNARLEIGRMIYVFPYGLRVSDAQLVTTASDGQQFKLLDVPKLEIALAKLPFGSGPLVIRELVLHEPAIHVLHTDAGLVGRKGLVKGEEHAPSDEASETKLSEMFELRRVAIVNGQLVYEDRTRRDVVPVVWRNVNVDLGTQPATNPLYQFELRVRNGQIVAADVAGTLDIDQLHVAAERVSLRMESKPGVTESPAPLSLQKFITRNGLYGTVSLDGRGTVDVKNPAAASFDASVSVRDDGTPGAAAIVLRCSTSPLRPSQEALASLQRTAALAAAASQPATAPATASSKRPPTLYLLVENGRKTFGDNVVILHAADAVINWDAGRWDLHELRGQVVVGEDKRALPKFLRTALEAPRFIGTIDVTATGGASLVRGPSGERGYRFDVRATSPHLLATGRKLVFTDVACDFAVMPGVVEFLRDDKNDGIRAATYGGSLVARGRITTRKPVRYEFTGAARHVDLKALAQDWPTSDDEQPPKFSGIGSIAMRFSGSASSREGARASELFFAEGEVEIAEGDFYEFPILKDVVTAATTSRDAATVGQAAGLFDVAERKIRFSKAAVSAPLLGLQGSGVATFDGDLDFRAVAAPLSDWKKQLQRTKIPIVDKVGAELLGGIQKLLNTASGKLLYQFRIGGTTDKPVVTTEPVPVVTEDALKLFAEMLGAKKDDRLLERIKPKKSDGR